MASQSYAITPIPRETIRAARTIFGYENFYLTVGDQLETILQETELNYLLQTGEEAVISPVVTFFQFLESLTDIQAIDAVRVRIDWKFALHLPINPKVFHESTLCDFRQRVLRNPQQQYEFQMLIDRLVMLHPPFINKFQQFKVLDLLSVVCSVNCLSQIRDVMGLALEALARRSPEWLRKIALPHWYGSYSYKAPGFDATVSLFRQELLMQEINRDIHHLLEEVRRSGSQEIKEMQEIKILDHIWQRQFEKTGITLDDKNNLLKLNNCTLCILKERRNFGSKYL